MVRVCSTVLRPSPGHRCWVLALDPVQRAPGAIGGVAALRHDAFEPKLAGVLEDERPVVLVEVLVEAQARRRAHKQAGQCRLAHGERVTAQVERAPVVSPYERMTECRRPRTRRPPIDSAVPPKRFCNINITVAKNLKPTNEA